MMKSIPVWKQELSDGVHAARLASLYCCSPAETASEAARYTAVLDGLEKPSAPTLRPAFTAHRAAPRSAATTPTISMAGCWPAA